MDPIERMEAAVRAALLRPGMGVSGGPLLVACSGGPDSLTLLDVLAGLGVPLRVACVDHGLRAAAADEARAVERFAASLGVPATVLRVQVAKATMAGARRARYDALCAHALAIGAPAIAVAHTATDQAETLLDRLVRGAGVRGLSAMARVRDAAPGIRLIRPLLDVTRDEIEAYVVARALPVARDPTNENPV
jgi:tRNA(Ile)-lysidine synthase